MRQELTEEKAVDQEKIGKIIEIVMASKCVDPKVKKINLEQSSLAALIIEWQKKWNLKSKIKARRLRAKNNYYQRNKAKVIESTAQYNKKYGSTELTRAHNAVRSLKKQPCVICGKKETQAHHPDYKQPKNVVWLCIQHHKQIHSIVLKAFNQ
jgi:hypothetical protein